ncbi:cysteine desulfurase family protein [Actinosynnema sp. NPDC047251]|uniref:Putative cysteine desulfurase n=1 Tax=Saccharothrix espanaensis (strain ATCC 51144 / DSM 44229 / JCM 9112 / NBRC 15066 / NRRL 15764) TaxID=1179773 RepID=K0K7X5_SACES|nr:cysteine desulfurase family protein [Saccharothrix espanaensis]CCH34481.1 putative cysteine desulfurase [Saccharothrix espanaensis DSM 44229]
MAYFDHAATTPMLPEAIEAMTRALSTTGNASSLHTSGRRARRAVEEAREDIADALGTRPSEVIFTSGGTESDNLAVKGVYWARRTDRRRRVVASSVEHHAVLDTVQWLAEHEGASVTWLEPDELGRIRPEALAEVLDDDVALVTAMWANNEVGTVNPVVELAALAAARGIPFHTDAVQAVGAVPVDFTASGASALTVSGHKVGGPYGVGVLLLGRDVPTTPLLHGGGQERDVRSGTLDVPAIVALAAAVRHAVTEQVARAGELAALRDDLLAQVRRAVPDVLLNGDPVDRLPGNAHLTFPGCEGDSLLMLLDAKGIECSTGSACTAGVAQPSHVLLAMGVDPVLARGSLRFSLGHTSTTGEVRELAEAIGPVVDRARTAGIAGMKRLKAEV